MSRRSRAAGLPARLQIGGVELPTAIVFPFLVSLLMTLTVSGISTARAIGLARVAAAPSAWIGTWLSAYAFAWPIVFPTLLVVNAVVARFLRRFAYPALDVSPSSGTEGR